MARSLYSIGLGRLLAISLLAIPVLAYALDSLPDPTRPPVGVGISNGILGEEGEKAPTPMPVLQSVILSSVRKAAVISGQTVELGGKFGDSHVIKITPDGVVLKGEDGVQILKLFPDVEKKQRVAPADELVKIKKKKPGASSGKKVKS